MHWERWADISKEAILSLANQEWSNSQLYDVLPAMHLSCPKLVSCEVLDTPEKNG